MPEKKRIRVLLVEDSPATKENLESLLLRDPDFEIVGWARTGEEALQLASTAAPDLITMDLFLEGDLGGERISQMIMGTRPCPIVVITAKESGREAMDALKYGALEILPKPSPEMFRDPEKVRKFLNELKLLARIAVIRRPLGAEAAQLQGRLGEGLSLIAIGSSTGGAKVLLDILKELPKGRNAAVLVSHHVRAEFQLDFVDWLSRQVPYRVKLAEHGERISGDVIYISPQDVHLRLGTGGLIELSQAPPIRGFRPSATELFGSLASLAPSRTIGVILSGMGDDGAKGLLDLCEKKGHTIAQDRETSIVYGMPKAAADLGAASEILPAEKIGGAITARLELWNRT
ncbi:MAG: response regulator [Armatimonadetes bacterium]|nr:response regulator [Armatimonadota bacterium]